MVAANGGASGTPLNFKHPEMQETIIEFQSVSKRYGDHPAVQELDLQIAKGEIFGLLGPNGAGKTTTMFMILGLIEPSQGHIRVMGQSPYRSAIEVKRKIGYLADTIGFYEQMSAKDNLTFIARLNQVAGQHLDRRVDDLLDLVGLSSVANNKAGTYSRGMKQRLGIAQALIKRPKILILDEPTLGLDPKGVEELLDLVQHLNRQHGITVIISSHQLDQVQKICHRVGIFVQGKLKAMGSIKDLSEQLSLELGHNCSISWHQEAEVDTVALDGLLKARFTPSRISWGQNSLSITTTEFLTPQLVACCASQGLPITQVQSNELTLEEIYGKYFENEKDRSKSTTI